MAAVGKVLVLSVKAGAGHVRAAQALEAAFAEEHPEVEVRHVETLAHTNAAFRKSYTGAYEELVRHLPSVWGMIYERMERKSVDSTMKRLAALVDRLNARPLLKQVEAFDPDRIVCTHYLPAELLAPRRRKGKLDCPLFVTLTDYDIHTMWVQPGADGYFVATDEMAHALRAKGVGDATVAVTGIPIMPVFAKRYPGKAAMRRRLGLRPEPPTVLVAAGGFGLAGIDETVASLADVADDAQLLAIAGRNEKLEAKLRAVAESRPGRIVPFGFVDNMHDLMAASDLAVTKCGGLTSSECMAMGLPMVIIDPIPGQEERNADYLLENGVAVKANSPAHLLYKVGRLLGDPERLAAMSAAARRIAKPRAAFGVAGCVMRDS